MNGGPAGLVYGYLFAWGGAMLQAVVMAEMASMCVYPLVHICTLRFFFVGITVTSRSPILAGLRLYLACYSEPCAI